MQVRNLVKIILITLAVFLLLAVGAGYAAYKTFFVSGPSSLKEALQPPTTSPLATPTTETLPNPVTSQGNTDKNMPNFTSQTFNSCKVKVPLPPDTSNWKAEETNINTGIADISTVKINYRNSTVLSVSCLPNTKQYTTDQILSSGEFSSLIGSLKNVSKSSQWTRTVIKISKDNQTEAYIFTTPSFIYIVTKNMNTVDGNNVVTLEKIFDGLEFS